MQCAESRLPVAHPSRLLAAGVVLAGAAVIAAQAGAPALPDTPELQQYEVQLAAADYFDIVANSVQGSLAGIGGIWSGMGPVKGIEALLPQVFEYLQDGNATEAYNLLNKDMLFNMNNIFGPLFHHEVGHNTGVFEEGLFSLPAVLARDLGLPAPITATLAVFGDFTVWKGAAEASMSPGIGAMYALADNFTPTGGHVAQNPLDAFFNGYIPWGPQAGSETAHAPLIGMFSEGGPFDYFFRIIPEQITAAMAPADTPDVPDIADVPHVAID